MTDSKPFSLDDKYLLDDGIVALSGVQALVRLPIDQHKADAQAGLNTATLISGYRGRHRRGRRGQPLPLVSAGQLTPKVAVRPT